MDEREVPDLLSVAAVLRPLAAGELPSRIGYTAYGLALRLLSLADPVLTASVRAGQGKRALSCAILSARAPSGTGRLSVTPSDVLVLRLAATHPAVSWLLARAASSAPRPVRLGSVPCGLSWSDPHPAAEIWRTGESLEQLARRAEEADALTVEFVTPTTFRREAVRAEGLPEADCPFPLPELVLGSVARAWWRAGHPPLPLPDLRRVSVLAHRLETRGWEVSWARHVGFVGIVTYSLAGVAAEGRRALQVLGAFAFYSGVGDRTTQGMGVVRVRGRSAADGGPSEETDRVRATSEHPLLVSTSGGRE
jgi:CRISPR-associated endoribonuclease Cas6